MCFAVYYYFFIFVDKLTKFVLRRKYMLIRRFIQIFLCGVVALFAASCNPTPDIEKVTPQIIAQTHTNGSTDVKVEPTDVIILFDRPVRLNRAEEVFFEPHLPIEVSVADEMLTITTLEAMKYLTDYTLTIGYGAVVDKETGGENQERLISFRTEEGPYVPPTEPAVMLANGEAMPLAQDIYTYLWSIYGNYTLTSASVDEYWMKNEAEWVAQWTGLHPAILNLEFRHLYASPSTHLNYNDLSVGKEWWSAGGLLSACWHWSVPVEEGMRKYTCESSATRFDIRKMFTEGTWENGVLQADLAEMAEILLAYQREGIVILWSPLQEEIEMATINTNKSLYWWGVKGREPYRKLWQTMFDYLRNKGVNNLIWVWNTRLGDADYFPGDDYVDIVVCNANSDASPTTAENLWRRVGEIYPHRMLALCEAGKMGDISRQLDMGIAWSFVMPWYDGDNDFSEGFAHRSAPISWWRGAFEDTRVIVREDLPRFQ